MVMTDRGSRRAYTGERAGWPVAPCEARLPAEGRILVVEEDDAIAEVFTLVLSQEGYSVERAASPREALALLERCGADAFRVVLSAPFADPFAAPYAWLDRLRARTGAAIVICSRFPARLYGDRWKGCYAALLEEPFDVREMSELVAALYHGSTAPS